MMFRFNKFKIFRTIINFISIFMMDVFIALEWSIKNLRHYETMFINFATFISHWIFWKIHFTISMRCYFSKIWISSCFSGSQMATINTSKRKISDAFFLSIVIFMRNRMNFFTIRTFNKCNIFSINNFKLFHMIILPYFNEQLKGELV